MPTQIVTPILALSEIPDYAPITQAVQTNTLRPAISTARSLNLTELLGQVLLDDLQAKVNTVYKIAGATNANPIVVTTSKPHGITSGDQVTIGGARGMMLDGTYTATVLTSVTFSIPIDGASLGIYEASTASVGRMSDLYWQLWQLCRYSIAWWTVVQVLPFQWTQIREAGAVQLAADGGKPAGVDDLKFVQQTAIRNAKLYDEHIRNLLCDNSTVFPNWRNDPAGKGNASTGKPTRRFEPL
jgi:predicted secreted protein